MIFSYYVSDDSSSDGERTEDLAKQRRLLRSMFDPLELSSQAFKKNFRVSKEIFLDILNEIEPKFPPARPIEGVHTYVEQLEARPPRLTTVAHRSRMVIFMSEHRFTPKEMLAATLRFLAEGSYQNGTGKDFNIAIAQPTFSVAFAKCLKILEETLAPKHISLQMEPNEQQDARRYFFSKSGIPGVLMCVDGTHIKIIAPVENSDQHFNRIDAFP